MESHQNSVAVGSNSVTDADDTVSVGKAASGGVAEYKRRIMHVADGVDDSDVATVGQLSGMLASSAVWCDNVAGLRTKNLSIGMVGATKGYYTADDGGDAFYFVRAKTETDVDDGGSTIILDNDNVAELITEDTINVKHFGAKGDGVVDDTTAIKNAIRYIYYHGQEIGRTFGGTTLFFPFGTYSVSEQLEFNWTQSVKIRLDGAEIKATAAIPSVIKCQNCWANNNAISGGIINMNHLAEKGLWLERTNAGFLVDNITVSNVGNGVGIYMGNPDTLGRSGAAHIINNITVTDYQGSGVDGGSVTYTNGMGIHVRVNDCYFNNVFVYCIRTAMRIETGGHNLTNIHVWHNMSPDNADWEGITGVYNLVKNNVWDGLYVDNYAKGIYTVTTSITQYFYYIPAPPSTDKNCSIIETWTDSKVNVEWLYADKVSNCNITVCKNIDPDASLATSDRQSNDITIKHNIKVVDGFNPVDPAFDLRVNYYTQSLNKHGTWNIDAGHYLLGYLSKTTGIGELTISVPAYGCATFRINVDRTNGILGIDAKKLYSNGVRATYLSLVISQDITIDGKPVYPVYVKTTEDLAYTKFLVNYRSYGIQEFYLKAVNETADAYVSSVTAINEVSFEADVDVEQNRKWDNTLLPAYSVWYPSGYNADTTILLNSQQKNLTNNEGATITVQDVVNYVDDDPTPNENFTRTTGLFYTAAYEGYSANTSEAITQNFAGIQSIVKNNIGGIVGVSAVQGRLYSPDANPNPNVVTYGGNKGVSVGGGSFNSLPCSYGGYMYGAEFDLYDNYTGGTFPTYTPNTDIWGDSAMPRPTAALMLSVGGYTQPVSAVLCMNSATNTGAWNGIFMGGSAFKMNGQSGYPGTVGINFGGWRQGANYGHTAIRFGYAVRHIYARDGLKAVSNYTYILPKTNNDGVNFNVVSTASQASAIGLGRNVDVENDETMANYTQEADISYLASSDQLRIRSIKNIAFLTGTGSFGSYGYIMTPSLLRPTTDNHATLGSADSRWSTLFTQAVQGTNTINITATDGNSQTSTLALGSDGSLKVDNNNVALAKDVLPLTGGTMSGAVTTTVSDFVKKSNDTAYLRLMGGTALANGASITLIGKDHSTQPGQFLLRAKDASSQKDLVGKPDGTLTWGGNAILTADGGTVTGELTLNNPNSNTKMLIDTSAISIVGSGTDKGLSILGKGGDFNETNLILRSSNLSNNPRFGLTAGNGTTSKSLIGMPDGTLMWGGENVFRGTITTATNGGYEINSVANFVTMWTRINMAQGTTTTWTFPVAMANAYYCRYACNEDGNSVVLSNNTTTSITVQNNSTKNYDNICVLIIGTPAS